MPGIPEVKKEKGYDYYSVTTENVSDRLANGWEFADSNIANMWENHPGLVEMWAMRKRSEAQPETEYFDLATSVKATKNMVETVKKIHPEDYKRICDHLDLLVN